jgi:hypothetical protein
MLSRYPKEQNIPRRPVRYIPSNHRFDTLTRDLSNPSAPQSYKTVQPIDFYQQIKRSPERPRVGRESITPCS